ncbi:hypothetical protein BS78_09G175300 [Paspalum vaginatum]|nr:hypothetical protein BS78_09G175300 [Paspalum vaginatum]
MDIILFYFCPSQYVFEFTVRLFVVRPAIAPLQLCRTTTHWPAPLLPPPFTISQIPSPVSISPPHPPQYSFAFLASAPPIHLQSELRASAVPARRRYHPQFWAWASQAKAGSTAPSLPCRSSRSTAAAPVPSLPRAALAAPSPGERPPRASRPACSCYAAASSSGTSPPTRTPPGRSSAGPQSSAQLPDSTTACRKRRRTPRGVAAVSRLVPRRTPDLPPTAAASWSLCASRPAPASASSQWRESGALLRCRDHAVVMLSAQVADRLTTILLGDLYAATGGWKLDSSTAPDIIVKRRTCPVSRLFRWGTSVVSVK